MQKVKSLFCQFNAMQPPEVTPSYSLGGEINAYSKMTFVETIKIDNPKIF